MDGICCALCVGIKRPGETQTKKKLKTTFSIGDRVAYNKTFLKLCGGDYHCAQMRGTITGLKTYGRAHQVASIKWDHDTDELRAGAATANLCKVLHIPADSCS